MKKNMPLADLKTFRDRLGLSAEAFARVVGVSGGSVVRGWQRNGAPPWLILLMEMADRYPAVADDLKKRGSPATADE